MSQRGSISLSRSTYEKLSAYCELYGVSMSTVVEQCIKEHLDAQPENLLGEPPQVEGERR